MNIYETLSLNAPNHFIPNISGRIKFFRSIGNISFIKLMDAEGEIQLLLSKKNIENYREIVCELKIGTIISVSGTTGYSSTQEYSLFVSELKILRQPLNLFPDKYHGISDTNTIRNQRYMDCIYNKDTRNLFLNRSKMIQNIREFLIEQKFIEVETPILTPQASGALAKPFLTKRLATDEEFFLRISPETYLKRMMVGGFERIFEIGKNFRNEGISSQHLQEFTVVEWYAAYKDYLYNISLTQKLLEQLIEVKENQTVSYSYEQLFNHFLNKSYRDFEDPDVIYKKEIRPNLQNLTLIYDYPSNMLPLAATKKDNPEIAESFQFVWKGVEIVKGYTEQTDPIAQLNALYNQSNNREDGKMIIEEDFIEAMKFGMPPMSGVGIGIDRLIMLKYNLSSIKESVFFSL